MGCSPPTRRALAAALLCAMLVGACGSELEPGGPSWSLLTRSPDHVLSQPGTLVPDPHKQWGRYGRYGWGEQTHVLPGGEPIVWSRTRVSKLVLPAGERHDRELSISAMCPAPTRAGDPMRVDGSVRINGIVVGEIALFPELLTTSIPTPAAAWVEGDNLLEIEMQAMRRLPSVPTGPYYSLALAEVAYDEQREPLVVPAEGRLELMPHTGVDYIVDPAGPLDVCLRAEADGAGRARVEVARVDPATSEQIDVAMEFEQDVPAGSIDWRLPLPESRGGLLDVRVSWRADDAADAAPRLRFDALALCHRTKDDELAARRPPVFVIAIDTLSARHLSTYGYERDTTPNLDALASEGVVFENCVTNCPWTLPSFMGLMSGLYPRSHELDVQRASYPKQWERLFLARSRYTLAEAMRATGYDTAGFVDHLFLSGRFGFRQGFETYDTGASDVPITDYEGGVRLVTAKALAWLDGRASESPPFVFLHCFDVHGPYYGASNRFAGDEHHDARELRAGGVTNTYGMVHAYVTSGMYGGETPPTVPAGDVVAAYDEGLAFTDEQLGVFFDELRARGLWDEAIVVVTADHGETMARGDFWFGHGVLEDDVLRVPLIVKLPRGEQAGRRVDSWVQLIDLYPTLLDRLGVDVERDYLHGRSLAPEMRGETLPPRPLLTEDGFMEQAAIHFDGWRLSFEMPGTMETAASLLSYPALPRDWIEKHVPELAETGMTHATYALLQTREDYAQLVQSVRDAAQTEIELYRLPDETADLAQTDPQRREQLMRHFDEQRERRDRAKTLVRQEAVAAPLDDEDVDALRAVGYAGD